jgi:hypothetical protein
MRPRALLWIATTNLLNQLNVSASQIASMGLMSQWLMCVRIGLADVAQRDFGRSMARDDQHACQRLRKNGNPPVELRHLRYLIAAAEHGSFRKAAMALGIH